MEEPSAVSVTEGSSSTSGSSQQTNMLEFQTLYRVRRNQLKMVSDRGFPLTKTDEQELRALETPFVPGSPSWLVLQNYATRAEQLRVSTRSLFTSMYYWNVGDTHGSTSAAPETPPSPALLVYYAELPQKTKSLGVDALKRILEAYDHSRATQLVIISEVDFGTQAQNNLASLRLTHCWFFLDRHLIFNVTEHVLYSKHVLAKSSELGTIRPNQLPLIRANDAVCRYFGFIRGQILRIESTPPIPNLLLEKSVTYRLVV
jgi:DNA-directed RNA polymerase subunit H (RpoH/RPB5)